MRALRAILPLALVLAIALPAIVPVATADHVYSHRYVVHGRVTAADGTPVENVTVRLQVDFPYGGLCHEMPNSDTDAWGPTVTDPRTNAFGEWTYCIHAHAMDRNASYQIRALLDDETVRAVATADPLLRRSTMHVVPDAATGNGTEAWDGTYTVSGRVWNGTGERSVENVPVYGMTVNDAPVAVRYERKGVAIAEADAVTNGYGDFAVRLDVTDVRATDEVVLAWGERSWNMTPDATTRWSDFRVDVANVTEATDANASADTDADANASPDGDDDANGAGDDDADATRSGESGDATTPPVSAPLALAAVAAVAFTARSRWRGRG